MRTTTYKSKGYYELVRCVDKDHDYDGGKWWMVWDNNESRVMLETDYYDEAERVYHALAQDLDRVK